MKSKVSKNLIKILIILIVVALVAGITIHYINVRGKYVLGFFAFWGLIDSVADANDTATSGTLENSEPFSQYKCYDYHLKCLEIEEEESEYHKLSYALDNGESATKYATYSRITGEEENRFVSAFVKASKYGLDSGERVTMQNPESYINVLNDWTIDRIELFIAASNNDHLVCAVPKEVIRLTREQDVIEDFKTFILSEKSEDELKRPSEYPGLYTKDTSRYDYCVRVYFKESDNIIWESYVKRYIIDESEKDRYDNIYLIDVGIEPIYISQQNRVEAGIFNYPALFNWIDGAFQYLDSQESN